MGDRHGADGRSRLTAAMLQLIVARAGSLVFGLVGLIVLSRMLDPADFGRFAVCLAAFGVAQALVEFGLLQFAVREEKVLPLETLSLGVTISFAIALLICSLAVAAALLLPEQWLDPALAGALVPVAASLPLMALSLPRESGLHRALAFARPAIAGFASSAAEVVTAIALALAGWELMALAWGFLVGRIVQTAAFFIAAPVPAFVRPDLSRWRDMVGFGGALTSIRMLNRSADLAMLSIVTGIAGASVTGLLNRAQRIHDIPGETMLSGVRPAILPAFSDHLREGGTPTDLLAAKTERLAPLLWTAFGGIIVLADPLVQLLLGPGWEAVVPAVQLLALGGLAAPFTLMSMKFFVAVNALGAYSRLQLAYIGLKLAGVFAASFISLAAICAAISAANLCRAASLLFWYKRNMAYSLATEARLAARALVITAFGLAGPVALNFGTNLAPGPTVILSLICGSAGWLWALTLVRSPLAEDVAGALRAIRRLA